MSNPADHHPIHLPTKQVGTSGSILSSGTGFIVPDTLMEGTKGEGAEPPPSPPCGGVRQPCCGMLLASCTEEGLLCMEHGPDIVCDAPRCAAPTAVEGRPGVYACPDGSGGVLLVGTLVGAGG